MPTNRYNNNHPIETLKQHYELVDLAKRMGLLNELKLPADPAKMRPSRLAHINVRLENALRAAAEARVEKASEDAKR